MPIRFHCPACDQRLSIARQKSGQEVRCPNCRELIRVPKAGEPMAPEIASTGLAELEESGNVGGPPPSPPAIEVSSGGDAIPSIQVHDEFPRLEELESYQGPMVTADPSKLAVSRSIIFCQGLLLGVVAVVFFVFGMMVGRSSQPQQVGQGPPQPCWVTGEVVFRSSGREQVDEGSVVILLPRDRQPDQKTPVDGLRADDPPPSELHRNVQAIQAAGGDFVRVDKQGQFRLRAPDAGDYFLLVISKHARRSDKNRLNRRDLAQIGRYFLPAVDLFGDHDYRWMEISVNRDRQLNTVAF